MANSHLRELRCAYRDLRQRVPLWRRRLFWGMARYSCAEGPLDDDGPFAGEREAGCGWAITATVGVGVGRDVDGYRGVKLPEKIEAGCEQCGGNLELLEFNAVGSGTIEAPAPGHLPMLRVPSKRSASRLAHRGQFVAEVVKGQDRVPSG